MPPPTMERSAGLVSLGLVMEGERRTCGWNAKDVEWHRDTMLSCLISELESSEKLGLNELMRNRLFSGFPSRRKISWVHAKNNLLPPRQSVCIWLYEERSVEGAEWGTWIRGNECPPPVDIAVRLSNCTTTVRLAPLLHCEEHGLQFQPIKAAKSMCPKNCSHPWPMRISTFSVVRATAGMEENSTMEPYLEVDWKHQIFQ